MPVVSQKTEVPGTDAINWSDLAREEGVGSNTMTFRGTRFRKITETPGYWVSEDGKILTTRTGKIRFMKATDGRVMLTTENGKIHRSVKSLTMRAWDPEYEDRDIFYTKDGIYINSVFFKNIKRFPDYAISKDGRVYSVLSDIFIKAVFQKKDNPSGRNFGTYTLISRDGVPIKYTATMLLYDVWKVIPETGESVSFRGNGKVYIDSREFRRIPGFENFAVSETAEVVNLDTGRYRKVVNRSKSNPFRTGYVQITENRSIHRIFMKEAMKVW